MKRDPSNDLWYEAPPTTAVKDIIEALPEKYKEKAEKLIKELGDSIRINEDGKIIYKDNKVSSSSMFDILLWYLDRDKYPKPYDAGDFVKLIHGGTVALKWKSLYS